MSKHIQRKLNEMRYKAYRESVSELAFIRFMRSYYSITSPSLRYMLGSARASRVSNTTYCTMMGGFYPKLILELLTVYRASDLIGTDQPKESYWKRRRANMLPDRRTMKKLVDRRAKSKEEFFESLPKTSSYALEQNVEAIRELMGTVSAYPNQEGVNE